MIVRTTATLALVCALLLPESALAQTSVVTYHNDAARTGANLAEVVLTTTNVNVSQFGKLFERAVDDEIYGQPLYVAGVNVPGVGVRNVVYVTTNNDSVYAFDADDPAASAPLWSVNYTNPAAGIVPVAAPTSARPAAPTSDFAGNIGIGGTPVIDTVVADDVLRRRARRRTGRSCSACTRSTCRNGSRAPGQPAAHPGQRDRHGRRPRRAEQHRRSTRAPTISARDCCSITAPSTSRGRRTAIRVRITAGSWATTRPPCSRSWSTTRRPTAASPESGTRAAA